MVKNTINVGNVVFVSLKEGLKLSESKKKEARVKPALTNLHFDKFVCKLKENTTNHFSSQSGVTRLGDFGNFLATNFITKVAQMFGG